MAPFSSSKLCAFSFSFCFDRLQFGDAVAIIEVTPFPYVPLLLQC